MEKSVIHLNAGNDANGNPRRCYVIMDANLYVIDVIDEGYSGTRELEHRHPDLKPLAHSVPSFATTPKEYKSLMKWKPKA